MEFVNGNASRMAYEYIQESISSFSPEELNTTLKKVIAAPALANAALLAANGCTTTFVTVVSSLYMANNMPIPDFSELQNISNFQIGHKGNKSTNCDVDSKTKDSKISFETVDFSSINEELKIFNENFYTITDTSPPDWEDWFDEENPNINLHPLKTRTLSSGISVSSLASTTSSADVPKINGLGQYSNTSSNVSWINPTSNSLRHSSSSGISLTSFRSSSESLDIPNLTHSYKMPFSSTPLASDLKAALSPIKMALLHSLHPDWKRSSLTPKGALPQSKELNNHHRHILSSKIAESSNFKYSHWNRLSLSPRKSLTPFTTPTDILRNIPSSNVSLSLIPLDLTKKVKSNSVTHDSFKTSSSVTYDSTKLIVPSTNHTPVTSPTSYKSETFDLTTDTNTSPWVVVRSHDIESDTNITKNSINETFEKSAKKMWQRCRTQLF